MYYVDSPNPDIKESNTNTVYRYFGGKSQLSGGYITDIPYDRPEEAKSALGLSDVDWENVNTAEHVAIGQIECTPNDRMIHLENLTPTDETLSWTPVSATTDFEGGGMEHVLQNDFNEVVNVIDEKDYNPNFGYVSNDDIYHTNDDDIMNEFDDLEYDIQRDDVDDTYKTLIDEEDFISDSNDEWQYNVGEDTESIDSLIDDELIPSDDLEEWYSFTDDEGRDSRCYGDENGYEY